MTEASRDEARRIELGLQADREMAALAAEAASAKESDIVGWQESVEGRMEGLKGRSQGTNSYSAAAGKIESELKRLDEEEDADFRKRLPETQNRTASLQDSNYPGLPPCPVKGSMKQEIDL